MNLNLSQLLAKHHKLFWFLLLCSTLSTPSFSQCPAAPADASCFDGAASDPYAGFSNVVLSEISGDAAQSCACNDAIVEIAGPPGTVIGCMVVTDTEWAVLLPPGTVIPADGVFVIACLEDANSNCGVGINGSSNGLGAGGFSEGDFNMGVPIDFDVCDPANANFYDPAASGFTLDNPGTQSASGDGEQVFLFLPDGTPWDGIYWDGGGNGNPDHVSVTINGNDYTLGDNDGNGIVNDNPSTVIGGRGDGGNATAVPVLPTDMGCPCNTPTNPGTFTVPAIGGATDNGLWFNWTPGDHVGCNSSFIRLDPGTTAGGFGGSPSHMDGEITSSTTDAMGQNLDNGGGATGGTTTEGFTPTAFTPTACGDPAGEWAYTDHPTPGEANDDPTFVFYASTTNLCTPGMVTFTAEIYNWQHVEELSVSTHQGNMKTGSYVFDPILNMNVNWTTYAISGETTTLTYTTNITTPGTYNFGLVWDDWTDCCGTGGNPHSQANPNECYETEMFTVILADPLAFDCDGDGMADVPQVACNISCDPGPPAAGAINANDYFTGGTGDFSFTLTDLSGTNPDEVNATGVFLLPVDGTANAGYTITITDNGTCGFAPLTITIDDDCELPPICPENYSFTVDGAAGPVDACPGDVLEFCFAGDSLPAGGAILIQADLDNDGVFETDFCSEAIPEDPCPMQMGSGGTNVFIQSLIPNGSPSECGGAMPESITICNGCSCDTDNPAVDISGWEIDDNTGGTGAGDPAHVFPAGTILASGDCITLSCNYSVRPTFIWNNAGDDATLHDNLGALIDIVSYSSDPGDGMDVLDLCSVPTVAPMACCEFTVPADACPMGTFNFRAEVAPFDILNCPDAAGDELSPYSDTIAINVSCPVADLVPVGLDVCVADMASVTIDVMISGGTGPFDVVYAIDGVAQPGVVMAAPMGVITIAGPTTAEVKVSLVSITDQGGAMCLGSVDTDEACVNIRPTPAAQIDGSTQPTTCAPCDGTVTFSFTGNPTFDFEYSINGGAPIMVAGVSSPFTLTGLCAGTYDLVSVSDAGGCPGTITSNPQVLVAPGATEVAVSVQPEPFCNDGMATIDLTTDVTYTPAYSAADFFFFGVDPSGLPIDLTDPTTFPGFTIGTTVSSTVNQDIYVVYIDPATGCPSQAVISLMVNPALCCSPPTITCPADNLDLPAGCNPDLPPLATDYNLSGRPNPAFPTVNTPGCGALTLTSFQDTTDVGCMRTISRHYIITDSNMDADTCTQLFTFVFDTIAPTFVLPADTIINNTEDVNDLAVTGDITDTLDICGPGLIVMVSDSLDLTGCNNTGTILRTFTVSDACGNSSMQTQTITVQDTVPPSITCPADDLDLPAGCNVSPPPPATDFNDGGRPNPAFPTVSGGCGTLVLSSYQDTTDVGCMRTITRSYVITDENMNADTCMQTFTFVFDTIAPVFTPMPMDTLVDCDAIPPAPLVTAVDSCVMPVVMFTEMVVAGACQGESTITRTWTTTDDCGNAATHTQTIMVQDTTPPTFTIPGDTIINCNGGAMPIFVGLISDTLDNCGTGLSVLENFNRLSTGCNNTGLIAREFIVTDACGNSATQTQMITIQDTIGPTFTAPADTLMDCGQDFTDLSITGDISDTLDNCGTGLTVAVADVNALTACNNTGTITREFTVTDACGNSTVLTQVITVQDTVAPTFTVPADALVDCDQDLSDLSITGDVSDTLDNCGTGLTVVFADMNALTACNNTGTITREFTVSDACGNSTVLTQLITVQDTVAPTFTVPADTLIDCGQDFTDLSITGDVSDTLDNCGIGLTVVFTDVNALTACNSTGTITREFTVTDACGNSSVLTQVITVQDTIAPTFTAPADTLIDCGQDFTDLSITGDVSDTLDNCGTGLTVAVSDVNALTACNNTGTITREFTVTDACGNSSVLTQVITVQDTIAPTFTVPADTLIDCGQDFTDLSITGDVSDTLDNCGTGLTVVFADVNALTACNNTGTITREFTVTDACGNSSVLTQVITVQDTIAPTFTAPADTLIDCGQDLTDLAVTGDVSDTLDNCGTGLMVLVNDVEDLTGCNSTGTITREFTVTDACGNSTVLTQVITVQDTIAPTFTVPAAAVLECSADLSPDLTLVTDAMDECGSAPIVSAVDGANDGSGCGNTGTFIRTWTVTDSCGNASSQTQMITLEDTTPPEMSCMDINVELDANGMATIVPADVDDGSFDNCGNVTLSVDVMDFTCADLGAVIVVTLTGEDECGLTNTCTANATVVDLLAPVMNCPQDLTINLDPGACDVIYSYDVLATDNCDTNPVVVQVAGLPSGGLFEKDSTYVFEYTATDASGNVATCSWELTVEEYPTPTNSMNCNQAGVQISLDPNCEAVIGADDILEGGPYGCYDDFTVKLFFDELMTNPVPTSPMVTGANVGQTLYVSICDDNGNSCWGLALIEDKFAPPLECTTYEVACDEDLSPTMGGTPGFPLPATANVFQTNTQTGTNQYTVSNFDPCDNAALLSYSDWIDDIDCLMDPGNPFSQIIFRTWTFTDQYGNTSECEDTLNVVRGMISDITLPPHLDGIVNPALNCGEKEPAPASSSCGPVMGWNAIDNGINAGHPSPYDELYPCGNVKWFGTGVPQISGCNNVKATYTDIRINVCQDGNSEGCFNIIRNWLLIDACTNETVNHVQRIKIKDDEGPTITDIVDATISVAAWECEAIYYVPEPWIMDNCSDIDGDYTVTATAGKVDYLPAIGRWVITELPLGDFLLKVRAVDCCGNATEEEVTITVDDLVPPYVTCELYKTTSLSISGVASVLAASFDDGSYDACGPVYFKVIRMEDLLGTDDGSNANQSATDCDLINGDDSPSKFGNQVYFDDFVKFCCEDIGATDLQVKLRVFDRDPGLGPIDPNRMRPGGDLHGHYNDCWSNITVEDKLAPQITCPNDITVSCDFWFDMNDLNATFGTVVDDINAVNYIIVNDRYCNGDPNDPNGMGSTDYDPNNPSATYAKNFGSDGVAADNCSVTITENVVDNLNCGQGTITRIFTATDPDGRTASCVQRIRIVDCDPYFVNDTNCFNFDPFDGVRWPCNYNASSCGAATDPSVAGEPQIFNEDNCSQVTATHVDEDFPVVVDACFKIKRTWTVTDWCTFDEFDSDNNDVYDATDDGVIAGQWEYIQFINVLNSTAPVFGACEDIDICGYNANCTASAALTNTISDDCTAEDLLVVDFKIDLDNDGTYDLIGANVSPYPYPNPNGMPILSVSYADLGTGEYELTIENYEFPIGTHRILWIAEDKCSNVGTCQYLFDAQDCAKPTPKAFHGLAVDIQPVTNVVVVTAMMMDAGSFDNCCLAADPFRIASPSGGPNQTTPPSSTQVEFDCMQLGNQSVDFWVQDCNGNWDYVTSYVDVQNNMGACTGPSASISGTIENEGGGSVANVDVTLSGNSSNMPAPQLTGANGHYSFDNLQLNNNYVVTPEKDIDYRNGISTLDIVLISRHLIGLQPLDSPYKLIAADVDNSQNISTFDMIALQRLILYIDTEFANNTSWRFVEETHNFDNPSNPWTTAFPEVFSVNGLTANEMANFVAVKVGDVNGNANPGIAARANDRNFNGKIDFALQDLSMESGEEYTIDFRASDFVSCMGYQFTLNFDQTAVELLEVMPGKLDPNFGLTLFEEGVITSNWASTKALTLMEDEVLFSIQLKAKTAALLSNTVRLNSRYTFAEAYNQDLELMNIGLRFNNAEGSIASSGFSLYQNQPNPFKEVSLIGFDLPKAGTAELTIYDVSGKVLKRLVGDYPAGYNEVSITRSELAGSGVLYYQLDTADDSATMKMIVVD